MWRSRHHRKGLRRAGPGELIAIRELLGRCLWQPRNLNWWIGAVFALGSLFFLIGSVFFLAPKLAADASLDATAVNGIFFAGSIPFTLAAYLQLFQAANAEEFSPDTDLPQQRVVVFGWRPQDIGWLSCALQFAGTLLFNLNTFDALLPDLDWLQQDLEVWIPDFAGSILFLASGHMAFIETCHAHWAWKPRTISWWVTFVNLLGCVAFMISAVLAFVPPQGSTVHATILSVAFTLIGAIGFLIGSLLMLPESAAPHRDPVSN